MAVFDKIKAGGIMDVIRCDEPDYLIWKWHPVGSQKGNNTRENAIRWGSSIRVKDGEVAVFVYKQHGSMQDYIEGPRDAILQTANLPGLASIIGLAYQEGSPFQAEIYFINLAKIIQIPFSVPYFDLYDPRYLDYGVPTAVRGKITFSITHYPEFIRLHRLIDFDLNMFQIQIRDAMARYVKSIVTNIPMELNIPVVQIERAIGIINDKIESDVKEHFEKDFGVTISRIDINAIELDKESDGYRQLKAVTQDLATQTAKAQTEANIKNIKDMQRINAENMEETLRIQREEAQYAQHKQTQTTNFAAFQLEQQADVAIAGAEALGQMGANGATEISGGSMNPAAMMTGMAMGSAIGGNMAGMMTGMMQGMNGNQAVPSDPGMTPPPIPKLAYHVVINGQDSGAIDMNGLAQMVATGTLTKESLVWKPGMSEWTKAENVQELQHLLKVDGILNQEIPPIPTNN